MCKEFSCGRLVTKNESPPPPTWTPQVAPNYIHPWFPSPCAIWRALGLEHMHVSFLPSGDKEALSPWSRPLYLRLQYLLDPKSLPERLLLRLTY